MEDLLVIFLPMAKAFEAKNWALLGAGLLTLTVFVLRGFRTAKFIPDVWWPWVAVWIAVLTAVATGLAAERPWYEIVVTGVSVGLMAIGGWETLGRLIRGFIRWMQTGFGWHRLLRGLRGVLPPTDRPRLPPPDRPLPPPPPPPSLPPPAS